MNRRVLISSALLIVVWACRPQPLTNRPVSLNVEPDNTRGVVSAAALYDPKGEPVVLGPGEEYVDAGMSGSKLPEYPPELIALRLKPQVVSIRIVIDTEGAITSMGPSPIAKERPDERYAARFDESVRSAVSTWRFWPAAIRKFRPGRDSDGDGKADYRIMTAQVTLATAFDVAFTFRIVDGRPVVTKNDGK